MSSNDRQRLEVLLTKAAEDSDKHALHIQQVNDTHDYVRHLCSRLATIQDSTISMEIEKTVTDLLKQVDMSMKEIKNEQNQLEDVFTEMFNINVRLRNESNVHTIEYV